LNLYIRPYLTSLFLVVLLITFPPLAHAQGVGSVEGLPDLTVDSVTFDLGTGRPIVAIRNRGAVWAGEPHTPRTFHLNLQWYDAAGRSIGPTIGAWRYSLALETTTSTSLFYPPPEGAVGLQILLDAHGYVEENLTRRTTSSGCRF
jgi:hypothetical protein